MIEAMKRAKGIMANARDWFGNDPQDRWDEDEVYHELVDAVVDINKAIAQAEKQEPVAIGGEWKPCVKLPIVVHVREQRKGETHVSTREGITPVKEDDLIMRGVAGEEYPIGRELFNRTYTFDTAPPKRDLTCVCGAVWDGEQMVHAPRKREWVGLTDEEIALVCAECAASAHNWNDISFARAIEAKLKEKNGVS